MKKFSKYLMSAATVTALALSTGAFLKVYAAEAPASVVAGQPVDLTYAAEKALPSVVHIKYVQNSKTKTVEVQDGADSLTRLASSATPVAVRASSGCRPRSARLQDQA